MEGLSGLIYVNVSKITFLSDGVKHIAMAQHNIEVDGKNYIVTCVEKEASTWTASGFFNGKKVEQSGDSEVNAIHNWVSTAVLLHS